MSESRAAREWRELFTGHPAVWLLLSAAVVTMLVSRPHGVPEPVYSSEPSATPSASRVMEIRPAERVRTYAWLSRAAAKKYEPLADRIEPPTGFVRAQVAPGSFGDWLRHLPLRPAGSDVIGGNRRVLIPGDSPQVAAVAELQPGNSNLLNAGNIVLRLRAEYLWGVGAAADAVFHFTNGEAFAWSRWSAGERPIVQGREVRWNRSGDRDTSRSAYTGYMETLFRYATVYSLHADTREITDESIQPGDVFLTMGRPGHAVLVLDVAVDAGGSVRALLGQGGTPVRTFHILQASSVTPWFEIRTGASIAIPGASPVRLKQLRRWPEGSASAGQLAEGSKR